MLTEEIKGIIKQYAHLKPHEVALKLTGKNLPVRFIVDQIEGRQKAKDKLPTWYNCATTTFPPKLNMEQCSSEITAKYKAQILVGETIIDLTGGFGVDAYYFAQYFKNVIYIEQNEALMLIVKYNLVQLKVSNCDCIVGESIAQLSNMTNQVSAIYIDPARRDINNNKVSRLADCEPNILEVLTLLFEKTSIVLLKTSPMLDIDLALSELKQVAEVHIVSVDNECKEVIYALKSNGNLPKSEEVLIKTVNLFTNQEKCTQIFEFTRNEEQQASVSNVAAQKYLYEPNASILKAGAFKCITQKMNVLKLAPNTHLYTSQTLIEDFPGKIFEIKGMYKYKDKQLNGVKANVATRNFPYSPEEIKKEMKIKDGGQDFLYACRDLNDKPIIIHCKKVLTTN